MRKTIRGAMIAAAALLAIQLFAGGFFVQLGNPSANPEAKSMQAVLVARVTGCNDAAHAKVTATAEGIAGGHRETVALTAIPLSQAGVYALKQQWPVDGEWAVKLVATSAGRIASAVVPVEHGAVNRSAAKYFQRAPTAEEIDAVLTSGKAPAKLD